MRWLIEFGVVFGLWTLVAFAGAGADWLLLHQAGAQPSFAALLRRPLTEHWIWAALTPLAFALARRVPLARPRLARAAASHVVFFAALSLLHAALAEAAGSPMFVEPRHADTPRVLLRFLQSLYSDVWMYWPLVCIRALLDARQRERTRERSLAEARLALLQAQIRPHFLFNTLHAVVALLRVDARAAEDLLADLSELLRGAFARRAPESMLRDELALVQCYLRIEQRRLGERLRLRWHVDEAALDAAVPSLVLPSLVENAVVHGIAPLARPASLALEVRIQESRLAIVVADDGAGFTAPLREGVGLANTRERLVQLYGDDHCFRIDGSRGTRAELSIPLRRLAPHPPRWNPGDEDPHVDRRRRAAGTAEPVVAPR
jgi:two-component system, LytTR family, sensor kinase